MDQSSTYYEILEITPQADDFQIKDAYRRLAFEYHPDRNPFNRGVAELRFRLINEAYSHLKTREKRQRYNQLLRKQNVRGNKRPHNDNGFFAQLAALFTGRNTNSGT